MRILASYHGEVDKIRLASPLKKEEPTEKEIKVIFDSFVFI